MLVKQSSRVKSFIRVVSRVSTIEMVFAQSDIRMLGASLQRFSFQHFAHILSQKHASIREIFILEVFLRVQRIPQPEPLFSSRFFPLPLAIFTSSSYTSFMVLFFGLMLLLHTTLNFLLFFHLQSRILNSAIRFTSRCYRRS